MLNTRLALCDLSGPLIDLLLKLSGNEGETWAIALNKFLRRENPWKFYPINGEFFELTLDGDTPENRPLDLVRQFKHWRHEGRTIKDKQTRLFKLVPVDRCRNLDEVLNKLAPHGRIPEGQWIKAFKAAYPKPDGNGPIGVADYSWIDSIDDRRFPQINVDGVLDFGWAREDFDERWRWLVEVR